MRKSHKILTAVAVAGIAFAGGSAFTGTGLTNNAGATQFIGGQVSQSVTGATLASVAYAFADTTAKTSVNSITLTFADTADGLEVAATPSGGSGGTFTCGLVSANVSTCTFAPATAETGYTGLTSLAIDVTEAV
ncbi:hypothetical protein KRR55_19855 [Paeniglutamicibacter sp. ABSL32-1]|uniref:hypothetical protein n=1 Tax=Paeniglutamicibacter quisquiliarum TaxID=2849498 RepID=UPI001C2CF702|nr:hypothetical protein [Paeniglutamicibacter quisquiliarum]MBV1781361.1 hypothetical protein [Paeniglutamicibacter quisquiliarum]